ncbi:acetyltransferase [Geomonas subterranea]|uniref:Acetyltransferase n=1 Tax=Geomonas subterranea TaxID=2847989 RepID=A0ABX8LF21_9BACT|nr:acetyltransferase [Geomonas subterranea]QXE90592.1 acetyltransferase [Geomonas subterranea]QXM11328.1 acetyltransferase [Geomonas subterranea]
MSDPVLIIGAGGHAKVLVEALLAEGALIAGMLDADPARLGDSVLGVPVIGDDNTAEDFPRDAVRLVNGIGSIGLPEMRRSIFERFSARGYRFATVVHPSAVVASDVELGAGAQIMAGAVLQPGCRIGDNVIINTRASVDHDCTIGDHTHIAPGVTLSGGVTVGSGCHVGTGATVIQGVRIGDGSVIGAGAVVTKDVAAGLTVVGVPAKVVVR